MPPTLSLTTTQLAYLDAVDRHPTWAEAAGELGVSPSALSQGLAELERRLGVDLFEVDGRRRVPTPTAAHVLAYARDVLGATDDLADWLRARRGGEVGRLRLGMIDAAAIVHFPETLGWFRRERPGVELHLVVAPSGVVLDALRRGDLDLAVCVPPDLDDERLVVRPLLDEPLALYAPADTEPGPPASWGPWVAFPSGSHTRRLTGRALSRLGATYEVVAESNQPEVLGAMVRLGVGWAVLPVGQAESGADPLVRARPDPLCSRPIAVVGRASAVPSAAADALVEALIVAAGASPVVTSVPVGRGHAARGRAGAPRTGGRGPDRSARA